MISDNLRKIKRRFPNFFLCIKKIIEPVSEFECAISRKWVSGAHKRLMMIQWGLGNPEFIDHHIDLYYYWLKSGNPLAWERGVFNNLVIKRGGDVMELACGDGFNTKNFYSLIAKSILALDFDKNAIKTGKKKNNASNITYLLSDIRKDLPNKRFDNILWDAAIEHFTKEEIKNILKEIKSRLKEEGVLSGYTITEKENKQKQLKQHKYEFKDRRDLFEILSPFFKHLVVFETNYPNRDNLYFICSDDESKIPFSDKFAKKIQK
jgi:ubiquinone/menaquinone biosynthesis C-methylase UbiE